MLSFISKIGFDRLLRLRDPQESKASVSNGRAELIEMREAAALVESMACDAIAYQGPNGSRKAESLSLLNAFARPVLEVAAESAAGCLSQGVGLALTGLRTAALVSGDQLTEGLGRLQSLSSRQVPMLVHALFREDSVVGATHASYHASSDFGLFQLMPHSVQQAVDWMLLARWLTERSLVPGLIALDRRSLQKVVLPSGELVVEFLGDATGSIDSPSAAQLLLFGNQRPLTPGWFDLDRPVSFSSLQGSNDGVSAAIGRQAFFGDHLADLAVEGMAKLSGLTGRELSFVTRESVDRAEITIVTEGASYQTARAAAEYLRKSRSWKVGVLGLTWLRPFPSALVRESLSDRSRLLILECSSSAPAQGGPLTREIRDCLGGGAGQLMSVHYGMHGQPLHVGQLVKSIEELKESGARSKIFLGITTGKARIGEFPKREGLIKAVSTDYPVVTENIIREAPLLEIGTGIQTIEWIGLPAGSASDVLTRLGETVQSALGKPVQGVGWTPEPGVLAVRIQAAEAVGPMVESGTPVDVLLIGRAGLDLIYNPLSDLREGSKVVIDSDRSPQEIWELLPDYWRSEIGRLKLKLFKVEGGLEELSAAATSILTGAVDLPFTEIQWRDLESPRVDMDQVPQLIRRVEEVSTEYDNLPRFWGEVMQPKRGGISDNFPDPLFTVNVVPPYTAALARPRATALPNIPVLDAAKCTGCGDCWPACPDSAIGVTVVGIQAFLDAVADTTGMEGKVAAAVKRAHRPMAAKLATMISGSTRTITAEMLREAYSSVVSKMPISAQEKPEYDKVFETTVRMASRLTPVATATFFDEAENALKGSGSLFLLTINPDACQGCQICINACPESALLAADRGGEARIDARLGWKLWEQLPDTPGTVIEQAAGRLTKGRLAASMLSRHCSQVQAVGSFGEPGSGERLGARLVTSMVEWKQQQSFAGLAGQCRELAQSLREKVQAQLAEGLVSADPGAVEEALKKLPRRRTSLSELSDTLAGFGTAVNLDPVKTLRLAQAAHELENEEWRILEGVHGLGRSRFGVVILSERLARWAGRFPNHPYQAPLLVDPSSEGMDLVLGIAEALAAQHLARIRLLKRAALLLEAPSDLPGKLADLEFLEWVDLSDAEKSGCAPLLVLTDESMCGRQSASNLARAFGSGLPIKIVLLDGCGLESKLNPILLGLSCPMAFTLSGAVSHVRHLGEGISRAVDYPGPALILLHAPVASEHGYTAAKTVERARLAVESRVHPLLVFDPSAKGVFGTRIELAGNPEGDPWSKIDPVQWAMGESRFKNQFAPLSAESSALSLEDFLGMDPSERSSRSVKTTDPSTGAEFSVGESLVSFAEQKTLSWKILRELSGLENPFVDRVRDELKQEVEAEHQVKVDALKTEYEARIAQMETDFDGLMASKLKDRLLRLAGFTQQSLSGKE